MASRVIASAHAVPTWVLHGPGVDPARMAAMREAGVTLIAVPAERAGIDLAAALAALGRAGLTRVLVEGGAMIAGSLLRGGLVDRMAWFHAPAVMGGDGLAAAAAFGVTALDGMPRFVRTGQRAVGDDMLTLYSRI